MEDTNFLVEVKFFIVIYTISRFFLLFIPASLPDIPKFNLNLESALIQNGLDYPGLLQLQVAFFNTLFGGNLIGLRFGLIIYEIGSITLLYKFAYIFQIQEFHKSSKEAIDNALIVVYIFAFFPNTIFNFSDFSETYSTFFVIAGLYAFYLNKNVLMAVFVGIGFLLEIYPIFFLIPILASLLRKKQFTIIVKIIVTFALIVIIGTLPFYFANPANFLSNYLGQFSRVPNAASLWDVIKANSTSWIIINVLGIIEISPIGLAFIIWIVSFTFYSLFSIYRSSSNSKRQVFLICILFLNILPVIFLSLMSRYVYFSFPLLCLFFDNKIKLKEGKQNMIRILVLSIIPISIITLLFFPLFNIIIMSEINLQDPSLYIVLSFILYIALPLLWIYYGKNLFLKKENMERPTIIQLLAFSFMGFFIQILSVEFIILYIIIFCLGLLGVIWSVKKIIWFKTDRLFDEKLN